MNAQECVGTLALVAYTVTTPRAAIMGERFYSGEEDGQITVREDGVRTVLDPRYDLKSEGSAEAFKSGTAWSMQVSLALLAHATGDDTHVL
jgi:hypothetical protein